MPTKRGYKTRLTEKKEHPKCQHLLDHDYITLTLPDGGNILVFFNVAGIRPDLSEITYYFDWLREYPELFCEPRLTMHVHITDPCRRHIWLSIPPQAMQALTTASVLMLLPIPRPFHDISPAQIFAYSEDRGSVAVDLTLPTAQEMLLHASVPVMLGSIKLRDDLTSATTDGHIH